MLSFLSVLTCVASSVYISCKCVYMYLSTNPTRGHGTSAALQLSGQEGIMPLGSVVT